MILGKMNKNFPGDIVKLFKEKLEDETIKECVKCGFCCTVGPCVFGEWNSEKHQCTFLTEENLCEKYQEIIESKNFKFNPAFGSGCSSSLFNQRREDKIREIRKVI